MSVVLTTLSAIALFWIFASKDFAINMTIFAACFALSELINVFISGKTITTKFREWAETQSRPRVWFVTGIIALVGIFFMLHLAVGI